MKGTTAAADVICESYPLYWPEGHARRSAELRRKGAFKVPFRTARDELMNELALLGAENITLSSNVPSRKDGLPYADHREPEDPGVAVYFDRAARRYVFACDTFACVLHNLRAIGQTIHSLRAIERYGASDMMEQAFGAFLALPPGSPSPAPAPAPVDWWTPLGLAPDAPLEAIHAAHRHLARRAHPDVGGSAAEMARINLAHDAAVRQRTGGPS